MFVLISPRTTASNIGSDNFDSASPLDAFASERLSPASSNTLLSNPPSRITLAASISVPWPSAMFCNAPISLASAAVSACMYRTSIFSAPLALARSKR